MAFIFYTTSCSRLNERSFNYLLQQVPVTIQGEILKFRKWEDQQRSLFGKMLLISGLKSLGFHAYSLKDLKYTKFLKPYFDDVMDFNISHSGEYIICAISNTGKIGVDIEEIQEIQLIGFESYFSAKEWNKVLRSNNSRHSFYNLWTQKEAFLKAIGTGLYVPLNMIPVEDGKITWEEKDWFLHEIKLDERYVAHLSTSVASPQILIEKIDFYKRF